MFTFASKKTWEVICDFSPHENELRSFSLEWCSFGLKCMVHVSLSRFYPNKFDKKVSLQTHVSVKSLYFQKMKVSSFQWFC